MGIPKFFRWLSERYPLINHKLADSDPPEFDNLYLDMNGIIHHCSHPFEDATQNVLSDRDIFISVMHYIDRLFHLVKPKRLLFLAVDGVAPRAKMNQQRQRRFRTAKDAAEALEAAKLRGDPMPDTKPFDSNCITPDIPVVALLIVRAGTDFMARLSQHLHFFIRKKMAEDDRWKAVKVIMSGHETPGEGEHKIMEYIRHCKAQPDWDPNQSHCMYGLDADLIMLGLASHEPNFALLRENVLNKPRKGGPKINGETPTDALEFHLLHLCVVREYFDIEFKQLKLNFGYVHRDILLLSNTNFSYDLERVIDDFILMCFFVGNDFLPGLPSLEISDGGLNRMITIYKEILPSLGGYLTDGADFDLPRIEKFLERMGVAERNTFEGVPLGGFDEEPERPNNDIESDSNTNENPTPHPHHRELVPATFLVGGDKDGDDDDDDGDDVWKTIYYREKFGHIPASEAPAFHQRLRASYLEGLSWVMHYYFYGCVSWEWFFPFHYAPLASDMQNLSSYNVKFNLGKPFLPFQQLLGVLPAASSACLPEAYRILMTSPDSPIIDFYPKEFSIDMTGKKNPWEGVVLVPFIDQKRLVEACDGVDTALLTPEERARNGFDAASLIQSDPSLAPQVLPSPAPDMADLQNCQSTSVKYALPELLPENTATHPERSHVFRLLPTTRLGKDAPSGFPTLKNMHFEPSLQFAKVNIFGFPSRQETLVLKLPQVEVSAILAAAQFHVGDQEKNRCYTNWPYLREAKVVSTSDTKMKCTGIYQQQAAGESSFSQVPHSSEGAAYWAKDSDWLRNKYISTKGIDLGEVKVLVHLRMLEGIETGKSGERHKRFTTFEEFFPYQLCLLLEKVNRDARYLEGRALSAVELFPVGKSVIYARQPYAGALGKVVSVTNSKLTLDMEETNSDQRLGHRIAASTAERYFALHQVAKIVGAPTKVLSKLTASAFFEPGRHNLGLNIKFSGKSLQVPGYTRRMDEMWEFSEAAIALLQEYKKRYPIVFSILLDDLDAYDVNALLPAKSPQQPQQSQPSDKKGENGDKSEKAAVRDLALEIGKWLKELPCANIAKVPCGSQAMPVAGIKAVEEAYASKQPAQHKVVTDVDPAAVLVPLDKNTNTIQPRHLMQEQQPKGKTNGRDSQNGPDNRGPTFALGDRVVNLLANNQIPFGARGTVVATRGSAVDIVFDQEMLGATNLLGKCADLRGASIPGEYLLNTSKLQQQNDRRGPAHQPQHNGQQRNQQPPQRQYQQQQQRQPHQQRQQQSQTQQHNQQTPHQQQFPNERRSAPQHPPGLEQPRASRAPQLKLLKRENGAHSEQVAPEVGSIIKHDAPLGESPNTTTTAPVLPTPPSPSMLPIPELNINRDTDDLARFWQSLQAPPSGQQPEQPVQSTEQRPILPQQAPSTTPAQPHQAFRDPHRSRQPKYVPRSQHQHQHQHQQAAPPLQQPGVHDTQPPLQPQQFPPQLAHLLPQVPIQQAQQPPRVLYNELQQVPYNESQQAPQPELTWQQQELQGQYRGNQRGNRQPRGHHTPHHQPSIRQKQPRHPQAQATHQPQLQPQPLQPQQLQPQQPQSQQPQSQPLPQQFQPQQQQHSHENASGLTWQQQLLDSGRGGHRGRGRRGRR